MRHLLSPVLRSFARSAAVAAVVGLLALRATAQSGDSPAPAAPPGSAQAPADAPAPSAAPVEAPPAAPSAPGATGPGAPSTASAEALAQAKELFKNGVTLFNAGDMERALDYFLRSRAAFASSKNTINAAICLDRLGRFDEALELYEEVLTRFAADLDDESRAAIAPAMTLLRQKVGSITVSANVEGSVLVDGRSRGKLPLTGPIRVLGGSHVVRVLKDGYAPAESTIKVDVGQVAEVDLRLKPLEAAGSLRIEDEGNPGAEVFVDRVAVGVSPWEGTLGPGKHLVWVRKGDVGTAPTVAEVVQGQMVLVRVQSLPLGVSVRIEPTPATAEVLLDGTLLGPGAWAGRLPTGPHVALVQEAGYFPRSVPIAVPPPGSSPVNVRVALAIDRNHPRWPRPGAAGKLWVGAFGGYAWSPSLKAGADDVCPGGCTGKERARGFLAGARAGYRFPFGLSVEVGGGYLSLRAAFFRVLEGKYAGKYAIRYYLDDDIGLGGPFASVGGSYRLGLGKWLALTGRAAAGMLFARSVDAYTAQAKTPTSPSVVLGIVGGGDPVHSIAVVVSPEIGAGVTFGPFEVGASLGAIVLVNGGPALDNGKLQVPHPEKCPRTDPASVYCAPVSTLVASERAYGSGVIALTPQVTAAYTF